MTPSLRVGLVGCGNMGSAIAARLAPVFDLVVFDLDSARSGALAGELGATSVAHLSDLGRDAAVVVLSLPSPTASKTVVDELATVLSRGTVVIETSTVAPADMLDMHTVVSALGGVMVDAAILSGVSNMAEGKSTLLLGGAAEDIDKARPVLDVLAERQLHVGDLGAGMAAKVANNAVAHTVMVVLLEATSLAESAGVAPARFAELLTDPDAGLLRPLNHRLLERVFGRDFSGGMPTEAALKDSKLAIELAQDGGVPLFALSASHTAYEIAVASGLGRMDYASLARLWEEWTGRAFGRSDE